LLPAISENAACSVLVEPVDLALPEQKNPAQYEFADAARMQLRVTQSERTAPGAAKYEPPMDTQRLTQALDVGYQVCGRIRFEASKRLAATRATLIKNDDPIASRIEKAASLDVSAATWPPMQKDSGFAGSVATLLVIDAMTVPDLEKTRGVRLDVWIEFSQGADCSLNDAARSRISKTEPGNAATMMLERCD
jgi:hypothetical protein